MAEDEFQFLTLVRMTAYAWAMGTYQQSSGNHGGHFKIGIVFIFMILLGANLANGSSVAEQIAAIKAEKNEAIFSVQSIVNQPVKHLKRTPDMNVRLFSPGWFHDGAVTPKFDTVDVRVTQEFPYVGRQYVTSDLNPGEVFLGDELEFNPMTKFFYTIRSLPKKRLTEVEMIEINRLYRIIGRCNQQLEELQNPPPLPEKIQQWTVAHKPVVAVIVGLLLVMLVFLRRRKSRELGMEN